MGIGICSLTSAPPNNNMKTLESWRRELRYRAGKPANQRYRTYPLQLRLKPEEVIALLDDIDELLDNSQKGSQ